MCLRHLRRVSADDATTFGWVNSIPAFLHILMSAMTRDHVKAILRGPHNEVEALREERTRLLQRIKELDLLIEQAGRGEE